jgi:hypothetical protein
MKWISVKDDLPPENIKFLLYGLGPYRTIDIISEGTFDPGKGWQSNLYEVLYWTEYPEVPVRQREKEKVED